MTNERHWRTLERMYSNAPCNEYYAPLLTVSDGRSEVVIEIKGKFFHSAGAIHGSVYFKALDDASFFAVNSLVKDVMVLTMDFNIYLMRPVSSGEIKAIGKVIQVSGDIFTAESRLFDTKGRKIARGRGRFTKSTIRLSRKIGYG